MNRIFENIIGLIIYIFIGNISVGKGQCIPPSADSCQGANIICSLSELNGYCCQNVDYSNPTGCTPLCPSGGAAHNTQWWAFVTQGGNVDIAINFSNCSVNGTGVQLGIWGDCNCKESIVCNPACNGPGSYMISVNLIPCKIYYLFVDGCSGDVCDFCLTTAWGDKPTLPPLGSIIGNRDLCVGACNIKYSIFNNSPCAPSYEWTLDGIKVGNESGELLLDFNDEGNFILCISSYIGNQFFNSSCGREGPSCININVRNKLDVKFGSYLIPQNLTPYLWHGMTILETGTYTKKFFDSSSCCNYDSIVNFYVYDRNILDIIITPNGDGYNDNFQIDFPYVDPVDMYVYDKWGANVYSEVDFKNIWNGIDHNGILLPSGVYVYSIGKKGGEIILKGTITIIR